MGRSWGAALAAAALAASAAAGASDAGGCELPRVDRQRATARDCMGCHDGSAGAAVSFQMARDGRGMDHPVDVDYASFAGARPDQYHPASTLPREVPLPRGRIECTTCHDGASRDRKRVAAVRDLCTACHRM